MVSREDYFKELGIETIPPQETQGSPVVYDSVEKMRQQLEIKKLQIELEKLEKPDTSIDYYSKMLELQEKNFQSQLEMAKQQGDLKLQIETLKLQDVGGSDDMMEWIKPLLPLLPQLLASKNQTPQPPQKIEVTEDKKEGASPSLNVETIVTGGDEMDITKDTTAGEMQEYINAIQNGEISYDEALEDFKASPYANLLTEEQFKEKFDKILNTKTI